ncbi:hypothetical protein [Streptomyces sp. DH10]|uniref:hypothetical protein n=1 Tax=Streptomyces sp. DH10 TaxID=3040121 RepID=UPI002442CACA|nr:hypothetical protein [Streptomyces sp. DH10]MDG9707045.1 hypothetical protein [Streptomyces sp. DH10]
MRQEGTPLMIHRKAREHRRQRGWRSPAKEFRGAVPASGNETGTRTALENPARSGETGRGV